MKPVLYNVVFPGERNGAVSFRKMEAGHHTRLHWHNFHEFELVLRGSGRHRCNGRNGSFSEGDCWLLNPADSHELYFESDTEIANWSFSDEALPEELRTRMENFTLCCRLEPEEVREIVGEFRRLSRSDVADPLNLLEWSSALNLLLIRIAGKDIGRNRPPSAALRTAIRWIRNHFQQEITLTQLGGVLSLSPNHVGQLFRRELGRSFPDYVMSLRLNCACRLLKQPELALKEVADRSGFGSIEYFHKIFKEQLGCTPSEYRNLKWKGLWS